MFVYISIVVIAYVLMGIIELSSFGSRVAGRVTGRVALGTTLAHSVYVGSKILLIFFLPALAFLVESGVTISDYLIMVMAAFLITFVLSIILILKFNSLQKFYQIVFRKYSHNSIPIALFKSLIYFYKDNTKLEDCNDFSFKKIVFKKTLTSFIAYIFLINSYFLSFMLALFFIEHRLTVSQIFTLIQSLGMFIMAFYLEPMLSRSIDSSSDNVSWLINVYSILLGRLLSYIAMILFLIFSLVLK